MKQGGKVVLVGAGPGDPGLLTLWGKRWLEEADVVVYDRLVSPELLEYAPEAEQIHVGKEQGHHPVPQHQINQILAGKAQEGKTVVRLKGGDPYLFGRGGEEAEYLRSKGIPFRVVPGVTSALAALCYAGVPATHRDAASALHIIAGHGAGELDYAVLSGLGGTLVFLMALHNLEEIVRGLLRAGMPGHTPAIVVENGTLATQRTVSAPLPEIAGKVRGFGILSPAVLAVGDVCAYRERLDWLRELPLAGKTVIVTRPRERSASLCGALRELGAQVLAVPCIQIRETGEERLARALEGVDQYAWLALTSPQGVAALFRALARMGRDARVLAPVRVAAVGAGTGEELAARGIRPDLIPRQFDAVHLARELAAAAGEGDRVLLLRAEGGTPALPAILEERGIPFDDIPVYRTLPAGEKSREQLRQALGTPVDYVVFTSPSTVRGFSEAAGSGGSFRAVCIGRETAAAAVEQGYRVLTAKSATVQSLIDTILLEETNNDDYQ